MSMSHRPSVSVSPQNSTNARPKVDSYNRPPKEVHKVENEESTAMRIHNAELYVETMQAADWSEKVITTGPTRKVRKTKEQKQREAFAEKQTVREHEFRQRFEIARREAERKAKERQNKLEKDFEHRYNKFAQDNATLIREVEGAIRADEAWRQRKKERLYDEWTMKVFQPMQDQINEHIAKMSDEDIELKRRYMFQCFLNESNRKANGLFRDIIIESDYDPLQQHKDATLKYAKASITDDPTKNRTTREMGDKMVQYLMQSKKPGERENTNEKRTFIPVEMWGSMEATPYGRYSEEENGTKKAPKSVDRNRSQVVLDHYAIPRGDEGIKLLNVENNVRGKKMVGSSHESLIKECFMPPIQQGSKGKGE